MSDLEKKLELKIKDIATELASLGIGMNAGEFTTLPDGFKGGNKNLLSLIEYYNKLILLQYKIGQNVWKDSKGKGNYFIQNLYITDQGGLGVTNTDGIIGDDTKFLIRLRNAPIIVYINPQNQSEIKYFIKTGPGTYNTTPEEVKGFVEKTFDDILKGQSNKMPTPVIALLKQYKENSKILFTQDQNLKVSTGSHEVTYTLVTPELKNEIENILEINPHDYKEEVRITAENPPAPKQFDPVKFNEEARKKFPDIDNTQRIVINDEKIVSYSTDKTKKAEMSLRAGADVDVAKLEANIKLSLGAALKYVSQERQKGDTIEKDFPVDNMKMDRAITVPKSINVTIDDNTLMVNGLIIGSVHEFHNNLARIARQLGGVSNKLADWTNLKTLLTQLYPHVGHEMGGLVTFSKSYSWILQQANENSEITTGRPDNFGRKVGLRLKYMPDLAPEVKKTPTIATPDPIKPIISEPGIPNIGPVIKPIIRHRSGTVLPKIGLDTEVNIKHGFTTTHIGQSIELKTEDKETKFRPHTVYSLFNEGMKMFTISVSRHNMENGNIVSSETKYDIDCREGEFKYIVSKDGDYIKITDKKESMGDGLEVRRERNEIIVTSDGRDVYYIKSEKDKIIIHSDFSEKFNEITKRCKLEISSLFSKYGFNGTDAKLHVKQDNKDGEYKCFRDNGQEYSFGNFSLNPFVHNKDKGTFTIDTCKNIFNNNKIEFDYGQYEKGNFAVYGEIEDDRKYKYKYHFTNFQSRPIDEEVVEAETKYVGFNQKFSYGKAEYGVVNGKLVIIEGGEKDGIRMEGESIILKGKANDAQKISLSKDGELIIEELIFQNNSNVESFNREINLYIEDLKDKDNNNHIKITKNKEGGYVVSSSNKPNDEEVINYFNAIIEEFKTVDLNSTLQTALKSFQDAKKFSIPVKYEHLREGLKKFLKEVNLSENVRASILSETLCLEEATLPSQLEVTENDGGKININYTGGHEFYKKFFNNLKINNYFDEGAHKPFNQINKLIPVDDTKVLNIIVSDENVQMKTTTKKDKIFFNKDDFKPLDQKAKDDLDLAMTHRIEVQRKKVEDLLKEEKIKLYATHVPKKKDNMGEFNDEVVAGNTGKAFLEQEKKEDGVKKSANPEVEEKLNHSVDLGMLNKVLNQEQEEKTKKKSSSVNGDAESKSTFKDFSKVKMIIDNKKNKKKANGLDNF